MHNTHTTIYKEQYNLKLGIRNLALSKASFIIGAILFMIFDGLILYVAYSCIMLLYYKFFFMQTRNGFQYNNLVFKYLILFNKKLRKHKQHTILRKHRNYE